MIELHQFPTYFGMPNASPFCMKVETWLKLAGLPYKIKWTPDPRKAPYGKLPLVKDGDRLIADSANIIEHLTRAHGVTLDAALSPQQRAAAHAFERMLSEHTYWAGMIYPRWIDPPGWAQVKPAFFGPLPRLLRNVVAGMIQKQTRRNLWGHGLGRHPHEEIYRRAAQDIGAIADYLGDQPYLMGAAPTSIDATVYAFVGNMYEVQLDLPVKALVAKHANLIAYCARMRERCFPQTKT